MAIELSREKEKKIAIDKADKPSRIEKITAALTEMEDGGAAADCITETPGAFLWEFYKAWLENGGQDGGKNRNSIRRMRDVWLTGENEVKSLHPKLTGKVRISKDDAKALMSLFLGRWKFVGVKEGDWVLTPDGYAPFPCRDCRKLCDRLADAVFPEDSEQAQHGLLLPNRPIGPQPVEASSEWKEIAGHYRDLDAVVTLSRHNSVIGPTPPATIRLFWHLMNYLYETIGKKETIFIWIIDIGVRQVEEDNAWKDFLNFEMMKTQFRAFASFDSENDLDSFESAAVLEDPSTRSGIHDAFLRSLTIPEEGHREKRWKWLCERSVIVIQNLRREEFEHLYVDEDQDVGKFRLRDIGVTAENILPSMMPNRWSQLRELRELYGRELSDISDATLTVMFKRSNRSAPSNDVRYVAHALSPRLADDLTWSSTAQSRELSTPGLNYDEAMRLVYWAARHRLKKFRGDLEESHRDDWAIATAYLAKEGFRVIRLAEFMRIHRSPGDLAT